MLLLAVMQQFKRHFESSTLLQCVHHCGFEFLKIHILTKLLSLFVAVSFNIPDVLLDNVITNVEWHSYLYDINYRHIKITKLKKDWVPRSFDGFWQKLSFQKYKLLCSRISEICFKQKWFSVILTSRFQIFLHLQNLVFS